MNSVVKQALRPWRLPSQPSALSQESLQVFREVGSEWGIALSRNVLGEVERVLGNYTEARSSYEETLAIFQKSGDRTNWVAALGNLGYVALREGDYKRSMDLLVEATNRYYELGSKHN